MSPSNLSPQFSWYHLAHLKFLDGSIQTIVLHQRNGEDSASMPAFPRGIFESITILTMTQRSLFNLSHVRDMQYVLDQGKYEDHGHY